ncbi:MAG: hypothetical protein WBM59_05195 [Sedimenticolaceae bacterium]
MKTFIAATALSQILLCSAAIADHPYVDPYALEPSINGGVSATGMFATQAEEDAYLVERQALELEPCINGDVSANGLFADQNTEDAFIATVVTN